MNLAYSVADGTDNKEEIEAGSRHESGAADARFRKPAVAARRK
jgi:hypothetical protein